MNKSLLAQKLASSVCVVAALTSFSRPHILDSSTLPLSIPIPSMTKARNLNRLVGATAQDVAELAPKTEIARRLIQCVNPSANVECIHDRWQNKQASLRDCAVIFGCVDSFTEREQLERFCRRFLIPYIDIGMDVLTFGNDYRIVGQVALSSPGGPCLRCMGILTQSNLQREAERYGFAGKQTAGRLAKWHIGFNGSRTACPTDKPLEQAKHVNGLF